MNATCKLISRRSLAGCGQFTNVCKLCTQSKQFERAALVQVERGRKLTHLDERGKINHVDVSSKRTSKRRAVAETRVSLSVEVFKLVRDNVVKKGDVESTVKIAGVMGAKMTSQLIPLCHNVQLDHVDVEVDYEEPNYVIIRVSSSCEGKTGVEMESLTGATIAALTLYDMCKSYGHDITITNTKLLMKSKRAVNLSDQLSENYTKMYNKLRNVLKFY